MSPVLVKEQSSSAVKEDEPYQSPDEVMAFCPVCKTFQTLWFAGNNMMPIRKFSQHGNHVYHDCGSKEPCRLFRGL